MKYLLDTHIVIWALFAPNQLTEKGYNIIADLNNTLYFSAANLWEISIKSRLNKQNFSVDSRLVRRTLLDNDYQELVIDSRHVITVGDLPDIHRDPFDRILIAQAMSEGITLLTADSTIAQYSAPIQLI